VCPTKALYADTDLVENIRETFNININMDNPQILNYTPETGSSYLSLPAMIENKKGTINPQNNDRKCFNWCVLAKHVTGRNKYCISNNYYQHESKYDFSGLSFPTPLCDVKIFERNNQKVSINVYGIEKKFDPLTKSVSHVIFPLKVAREEKAEHLE